MATCRRVTTVGVVLLSAEVNGVTGERMIMKWDDTAHNLVLYLT
jgi:hypothetical protein